MKVQRVLKLSRHLIACLLILSLTFFAGSNGLAQSPSSPRLQKEPWAAEWIAPKGLTGNAYAIFHCRKIMELQAVPVNFLVHVSADNRFKLFVNGHLVGLGPTRSDLFHWYYQSFDLAPWLKPGSNTVSAIVWNFGPQKPEAQISHRSGFILQGNGNAEAVLNTNAGWETALDETYQPLQPELVYTYYVAGPGELVDANKGLGQWQQAASIGKGIPKGVFDWSDGWMLVPNPLPPMEMKKQAFAKIRIADGVSMPDGFLEGKNPLQVPPNTSMTLLIDQGYLTNAFPELYLQRGKDASISMKYAEALYIKEADENRWKEQKQKGNRNEVEGKRMVGVQDSYISNGKPAQVFAPLVWRSFRYLQLKVETKAEALVIDSIFSRFTGYPFQFKADFSSGNKLHQDILEAGWRTARLCAVETYMDCPYYEQLQYLGDTRIQALVSLYNSGDDRLMRNAINQLNWSRMAEGITLSRFPTATPQQIPTFSLWWIGMIHDYWYYRNDPAWVKTLLPGIRQVIGFFEQQQLPDGRLSNIPYWPFTDWCNAPGWKNGMAPKGVDGATASIDLQMLWAYQQAIEMENQFGNKGIAADYTAKAGQLKRSIQENYWDSKRQLYADTREHTYFSQHTNSLAILVGMNNATINRSIAQKLMQDTSLAPATVYFLYYVNQALSKAGFGNEYLNRLQVWENNLKMGMTTWAEISDINNSRSDCHAWGASPNIEFFRVVLGIDTDAPGFKKVRIEPHPGNLKTLSGKIPHPEGEIAVSYTISPDGRLSGQIQLPAGLSGNLIWNNKTIALKGGLNQFDKVF